MLTADLVRARRRGAELTISPLSPKLRARAVELAAELDGCAQAAVGATRASLEQAWSQIAVGASERKLFLGLRKLVEDQLELEVQSTRDPAQLRAEVFAAAAAERRGLAEGARWDREAFLERQAVHYALSSDELLRNLYADLRSEQVIQRYAGMPPERWLERYELSQQQAVMLRAVQLSAEVRCRDAYAYRILFRKLKFFRLMHQIEARPDGGYRLCIDGPFGLFEASTKYGLALALSLPWLLSCDRYDISASLRWGKAREPLTYRLSGRGRAAPEDGAPQLPDEVAQLLARLQSLASPWQAEPASDLLHVPGAGVCVPDLRFIHRETGEVAYLEVLGYWSREAAFRRVELVERGLRERVLFAVSSRLRVSEQLLDGEAPSRLYVYKGTIAPREVLRRLSDPDMPASSQ